MPNTTNNTMLFRNGRAKLGRRLLAVFVVVGAILSALATSAFAVPVTQTSYPFPLRQIDLASGQYFLSGGDHGGLPSRDFEVVRYELGWRNYKGLTLQATDNNDYLIFGKPIFSPVDGEIVTCWKNHPENSGTTTQPGRSANPPTIIRAGNHLNIMTSDNKVMNIAHLQSGSIPPELCPHEGAFVQNAENKPGGDFPAEAVVAQPRTKVVQGQFLGRVGNTGASSRPHLHIHMQPIPDRNANPLAAGDIIDTKYHGLYIRPTDQSGDNQSSWQPLKDGPTPSGGSTQIYASPFLAPKAAAEVTDSPELATASVAGVGAITASQNRLGNLELRTHALDAAGQPSLRDRDGASAASQIALAHPGTGRDIVTAMRDSTGNLRLIGWDVSNTGHISRKGTATAGAVSKVAITNTPSPSGAVTAVRDEGGKLKLITWRVNNVNGTIERVADAGGVAVTDLAITTIKMGRALEDVGSGGIGAGTLPPFVGVVTAARDSEGLLRLDSWKIDADLKITHSKQILAGPISKLSVASTRSDFAHESVVTLIRDADNGFKATHWAVSWDGTFTRHDTTTGGEVQDVRLVGHGQDAIGTMLVNGTVRLMAFRTYADGRIGRDGENLPFGSAQILSTLSASIGRISSVSSPVTVSGRTYVLGTFGATVGAPVNLKSDWTVSWRYTM